MARLHIAEFRVFFVYGSPMSNINDLERFRERGATAVWALLQSLLTKKLTDLARLYARHGENVMNPKTNTPLADVKSLSKQETSPAPGQSKIMTLIYDFVTFSAKVLVVYYLLVIMFLPAVGQSVVGAVKTEVYNWTKLSLQTHGAAYVLLLVPNNPVLSAQVAAYFEKRGELAAALAAWEATAKNREEIDKTLTHEEVQRNIKRLNAAVGRQLESAN